MFKDQNLSVNNLPVGQCRAPVKFPHNIGISVSSSSYIQFSVSFIHLLTVAKIDLNVNQTVKLFTYYTVCAHTKHCELWTLNTKSLWKQWIANIYTEYWILLYNKAMDMNFSKGSTRSKKKDETETKKKKKLQNKWTISGSTIE